MSGACVNHGARLERLTRGQGKLFRLVYVTCTRLEGVSSHSALLALLPSFSLSTSKTSLKVSTTRRAGAFLNMLAVEDSGWQRGDRIERAWLRRKCSVLIPIFARYFFFFTAVSSCRQPDLSLLEASPQHISYAAKHQESRSDGSRRLRGHEAYHPRTGLESLENDKDQVSSAEAACGGVGVWKVHYRPYAQGKEEDVG